MDPARTAAVARFAPSRAAATALYDGAGGATLTATRSGVAAGTRIATPAGAVAVEDLRPGDVVATAAGTAHRVAAIARRALAADVLVRDADARPVRITAGAIADGVPQRELLLAPGQMLVIDGASVPAVALVNGASITRALPGEAVTYVCIRLDGPAAFLAEGAACDGFGAHAAAGSALAEARRKLEARSGMARGRLTGNVAGSDHAGAVGWTLDEAHPSAVVALEIVANGVVVAYALADVRRPDLEMAGVGEGRCGFRIRLRPPLPARRDNILEIHRVGDGADVPGSPLLLPRAARESADFDRALQQEMNAASTASARDDFALFLARQTDRLLQARADRPPVRAVTAREPPV